MALPEANTRHTSSWSILTRRRGNKQAAPDQWSVLLKAFPRGIGPTRDEPNCEPGRGLLASNNVCLITAAPPGDGDAQDRPTVVFGPLTTHESIRNSIPTTKMAMNFAPYQSSPPESERAKSPPLRSPTGSPKPQSPRPQRNISSIADREDPWAAARNQRLPDPSTYADEGGYSDLEAGGGYRQNDYIGQNALQGGGFTGGASIFETTLGFPLRIEACLAYLLLPPAGGVVLLLFEHKSDYVRFHAWQSAMLFSAIFLVHIIFSWQAVISWMLFACDLILIAYLTMCAYRNAETLDRVEVPFFGRLASSFVDDE